MCGYIKTANCARFLYWSHDMTFPPCNFNARISSTIEIMFWIIDSLHHSNNHPCIIFYIFVNLCFKLTSPCFLSVSGSCSLLTLVWQRSTETTVLDNTSPTEKTRTWLAQHVMLPSMHTLALNRGMCTHPSKKLISVCSEKMVVGLTSNLQNSWQRIMTISH